MAKKNDMNPNKEYKAINRPAETMIYGKVPPQAKEIESAILGAILLDKYAFDKASDIINADAFYVDANQRIFKACQQLEKANMPIDLMTVIERLKSNQELDAVGGPYYITKLTNEVVSSANIETHCRIIQQKFIQRELIRISGEIIADAYDDSTDAFELLDDAEGKILQVATAHLSTGYISLQTGMNEVLQKVEKLKAADRHITGVPSGFPSIDRVTHGWQPTDLIIIAARPSTGKSAFALNLARNAAKLAGQYGTGNVGFFSLEMSTGQLVQRIMSAESEIPLEYIKTGKIYDGSLKRLYRTVEHDLGGVKIFIDDTAALSVMQLKSKVRRMVSKDGVGLIIIDYLQLMSGETKRNDNREQEISKISRELKRLAKDIHVPIIALSQLSRQIETRADPTPKLSDLRESGAIEQDADVVVFISKPTPAAMESGALLKNIRYIDIAKHRDGALEKITLQAFDYIQKFAELGEPEPDLIPGQGNWTRV